MEVGVSQLARQSLSRIASYIEYHFGPSTTEERVRGIVSFIIALGNHPHIGRRAEAWCKYGEVRCAIYSYNQIYYLIDNDYLIVIVVWDSRQSQDHLAQLIASFFEDYIKNGRLNIIPF